MRRILLIVVGIIIGVTSTLLVQKARMQRMLRQYMQNQELNLSNIAENAINKNLAGARFLDASWSESTANVNYVYDKLYDVHVSYERDNQIKRFTMQLGTSGDVWITPNSSDLEILDDKAEIVYTKLQNVGPVSEAN
jgi:type II secretory pathway pseudopilin PulG